MNGVNFRYGKYMNWSCFSLGLVYEWVGVRGLQPHIRTKNHGKLPPPPCVNRDRYTVVNGTKLHILDNQKLVSVQVTLQLNKINFYIYLKELLKFIHENWLKFIHENCLSIVEIFGTLFW